MSDKKIKFLGMTIYKRKIKGNKTITRFLNIPIWKKKNTNRYINQSNGNSKDDHILKIGIKLKGGLGDILIGINYLYNIFKNIHKQNLLIDIYAHRNKLLVNALIPIDSFIDNVYLDDEIADNNDAYDCFIVLNRYPDICKKNMSKIYKYAPELIDWVQACEKWRLEHIRFFNHLPICDGESNKLSEILEKKRIQQPDIYNLYKIQENFSYELSIDARGINLLKTYNLNNHKFITIHRGVDDRQVNNSVKLWPQSYYNALLKYIKEAFPDIIIVQLGINHDRCPLFENIDIDLVGKTTIEELKAILKTSSLHIDCEGGMVHLRHALCGKASIVLFGPTSQEFYGYSENINLRGNGCPYPCEWVINNWQRQCARGFSKHPCMHSLTPKFVYTKTKEVLEKI